MLELALAELEGRPLADYFEGYWQKSAAKSKEAPPTTGGMMYHVFENKETKEIEFSVRTRMIGRDNVKQDDGLLFYILQVQNRSFILDQIYSSLRPTHSKWPNLQVSPKLQRQGTMERLGNGQVDFGRLSFQDLGIP